MLLILLGLAIIGLSLWAGRSTHWRKPRPLFAGPLGCFVNTVLALTGLGMILWGLLR